MIRTGPYPTTCCFLRHLLRPAIAAVGLALLALGPVGLAADADAYQRALAAGKARLEAGQLADAQKDFHAALQADSVGYDAYFHLAVVSFRLDDHAAALEYANAAVNAAADDQRPRARELLKAIRDARETEDLAHQADEALGKGLIAKAADLYARAFELAPDRGDLGLKGATLYATRLNRLLEAAVLFQRVIASGDANAATAAGAELGKLHARLTALYREQLPRAVAQGDLPTLAQLSRAFPEEAQPRLEVAVRNAIAGAGQATANWLGEAVTRGTGYDAIQERIVFLDLWEKDEPAFKAFIGDAFGSSAVNDMNRRLKERQDQQALERALAAEKARLEEIGRQNRLREQQLAQEKIDRENAARPLRAQLRQRVVEQLDAFLQGKPVKRIVRTVKDAYYHTVWHDYTARIFLQGDSYVLETRNR
ncbi:MAG TPA: hypothetical protein VHN79_05465, partial [Lacunisphaera sp.]|nr:hypothetical protein [Lacunisphaera sp.]